MARRYLFINLLTAHSKRRRVDTGYALTVCGYVAQTGRGSLRGWANYYGRFHPKALKPFVDEAKKAGGALYSLVAREFAPLPERLLHAAARMEKLPALLAQSRKELQPERVPLIHATMVAVN